MPDYEPVTYFGRYRTLGGLGPFQGTGEGEEAEHEKAQVLYRQVEAWNQDGQPKGVACPDGYLLINKDRAADILVASHRYAQAVKEAGHVAVP